MPKSEPLVIDELYAVLGKDADGNEGIASYINPNDMVMTPLVGSRLRVPTLLTVGKALAITSGLELQLVKFSVRGNLETLTPDEITKPETPGAKA